ncbi:Zinc finger BED domain-containing protein DAYSLEEPER [Striga hermonthica]|uniref:Zinc finger BED domain-containing protein DAYSLEEPER n=1 Tax=Striga hermonthica TaxID=68872 RepID=A0A9N7NCC7_STRHE|nr:Zinc finger BED domain-containing protein DAYSLEEPER [Striga hermonthica]
MSNPTPFHYFLQYPQLHLILEWVSHFFDLHHIRNLLSLHPVLPFVGLSRLTPYTHPVLPFGAFILFALSTLEIFVLSSIRVPIEARVPILALTRLSGTLYATSNMYFPEIVRTLKEIENFEKSNDTCLKEMGKQMRDKFDKYWGSINKINLMLLIAVVLNPRYKIKYLRVKYAIHYNEKEADELVDKVIKALRILIEDYRVLNETGRENQQRASSKDELERYLEELSEKYRVDFDILAWWKVNLVRYPNLSCVARDVLAIQSSTVASESAFSTGGRTLDRFRSSLTPTTAEVLICCQDWLRNAKTPNGVEEIIEDLEILEMGM